MTDTRTVTDGARRRAARGIALLAALGAVTPLTGGAVAAPDAPPPFEKYQTILDRMPFGALPADFGQAAAGAPALADAQAQAEQQKLAQQINMSCINVTPEGTTAIGFTDLGARPPVNFYLLVGATGGGWTVVDANYDEEWAQIEKDGVTITLQLGKGLVDAPPAHAAAPAVAGTAPALPMPPPALVRATPAAEMPLAPGLVRRASRAGSPPVQGIPAAQLNEMQTARAEIAKLKESGGDVKSYIERLRERKAKEKEEKAAAEAAARAKLQELAQKITQDELAKRERETNLSLIEQGARPVSDIELTAEEEAALVEKGVLAPAPAP